MKRVAILMILCLSLILSACGTAKTEEGTDLPEKEPVMDTQEQNKPDEQADKQDDPVKKAENIDRPVENSDRNQEETTKPNDKTEKPQGNSDKGDPVKRPIKPIDPEDHTKPAPTQKPNPKPEPNDKPEKHEHHYTSKKVPATCTKGGYTKHTCDCGDSYISDRTEPLGHKYGSWKTTKAPTYESEGKEQRTCSRCGKTQTRSIPKKTRPQLDFDKLCNYAINYAVDTYGYEYWPGMRDGYYPAYTCYITNMEEGYAAMRGCVDDLSLELTARGSGTDQMPFDIEIYPDPDGFEDYYCVQLYY